jgi:hypothetical protein
MRDVNPPSAAVAVMSMCAAAEINHRAFEGCGIDQEDAGAQAPSAPLARTVCAAAAFTRR